MFFLYVSVLVFLVSLIVFNILFLKVKITFPPVVFTSSFIILLITSIFSIYVFDFYPLSAAVMGVVLIGIVSFSIGGAGGFFLYKLKGNVQLIRKISGHSHHIHVIKIILLFLLTYLPLLYIEFSSRHPELSFGLQVLRLREEALTEQVYTVFSNNMIVLSSVMYLIVMYFFSIKRIHPIWLVLSLIMLIAYGVLTGTRATMIIIGISSILLYLNQSIIVSKRIVVGIFCFIILFGSIVAVFMGKDGADRDKGFVYNVPYVIENYFSYGVQGIFLFDNYVEGEGDITPNWDVLSGSKEFLNKLNITDFKENSKHAEFSSYAEDRSGNVYTIFFAVYPLYGIFGTFVFFTFFGFISSYLYYFPSFINSTLLGYVNGALVISIFNEQVFTNLIFLIKFLTVVFLVNLISKIKYENRRNRSLVQSEQ